MDKIVIYVSGGVVQNIVGTGRNTTITIFDEDDKKEAGLSEEQIEKEYSKITKGMISIF